MSILKKGWKALKKITKKVTNFVKKNWVMIVMVALSVFTMGLSTVGFAGFQAAMGAAGGGFTGFMSAVGNTMWAGITASAGSLGVGQGANVGAGSVFAEAGIAGGAQHVGLGAAMGAKGGYGLGKAGTTAAENAAKASLIDPGLTMNLPATTTPSATPGGAPTVNPATTVKTGGPNSFNLTKVTAKEGMGDMTKAALVMTGGSAVNGWAQAKMNEDPNMKGFWGLDMSKKGRRQMKKDYEAGLMSSPAAPTAPMVADVAPIPAMAPLDPIRAPTPPGLMGGPWEEEPQGVYG